MQKFDYLCENFMENKLKENHDGYHFASSGEDNTEKTSINKLDNTR